MAIYWPTPGFEGKTFKLCVLTRWDFNFCVLSSPLRGPLGDAGRRCNASVARGLYNQSEKDVNDVFVRLESNSFLLWDDAINISLVWLTPDNILCAVSLQLLRGQINAPILFRHKSNRVTFLLYKHIGDFNAHSPLWGHTRQDSRGHMLDKY